KLADAAAGELGAHGFAVRGALMGRDVDQRRLYFFSVGVTKLNACKRFQMLVEQPGMIDGGLQDQRLPARGGGAMTAQDGAGGQLRARHNVGRLRGANAEWRMANSGRMAARLSTPIRYSPFAIRASPGLLSRPRSLIRRKKQAPQPLAEIAPII